MIIAYLKLVVPLLSPSFLKIETIKDEETDMRPVLNMMKNMAVAAMMARLGIWRLVGCVVLLIIVMLACAGLILVQLFSS
jgi:hypothetical protein